ncbi:MAG: FKBP-type peptidyl-prolyl cis-trans isomerase [Sphingomonas taxi]
MSTVTAVPIPPVRRSYIWCWSRASRSRWSRRRRWRCRVTTCSPATPRAPGVVTTASGLQYKVLKPGSGAKPTDTDVALVMYEGKLLDGTTFDKSERPTPFPVQGVVPGFSEGLKLMPKGSKYRFWIKPSLGYGDKASGPIPANSVLVFDVELLDFLPEAYIRQMQMQQQMQQQMMGGGGGAMPGGPAGR